MNDFRIIRELNNDKSGYKNIYLYNNNIVNKQTFKKHLIFMIKNNNRLYYEDLKNNNFDYIKQYHNSNYFLLNYKDVLNDLKNGGLIYSFYVNIGIKGE